MPNKTEDWLDDLLDRHPNEPVPTGFAARLAARLDRGPGELTAPADRSNTEYRPHQTTMQRFLRPLLTVAAAGLLLSIGFMLGAGAGPDFNEILINSGDQNISSDINEIYEMRELLDSWELMSDQELEHSFRQMNDEDSGWLEDLLQDSASEEKPSLDGGLEE
ncbi:MAG: hypothetical protein HQ519_11200 [Planctomycetes bacterium]|nr:hypothetical protein [Planctomycetota bacterium]